MKKVALVLFVTLSVTILFVVTIKYHNDRLKDKYLYFLFSKITNSSEQHSVGSNILFIYSGRWKFLRIQLPYVYRELRVNGGVLDEVWFMMIKYDDETHKHLLNFTKTVNKALQKRIFFLQYMGYAPGKSPSERDAYTLPYFHVFNDMIKHPNNRYFKFDDDIVYVHPGAFKAILDHKNSSKCFMHFFNIAGNNWRCSWLHQKMNVYKGLNPHNLNFDYDPSAKCGWKGPDCAELTLRTFLHHYKHNQLDKYLFEGLEVLSDRKRFSINAYLLDKDLIDLNAVQKVGAISKDDEGWWTVQYTSKVANPNCIIGEALVVHFAYSVVVRNMLDLGFLQTFEDIVKSNMNSFKIDSQIWKSLEYQPSL